MTTKTLYMVAIGNDTIVSCTDDPETALTYFRLEVKNGSLPTLTSLKVRG